MSPFWKKIKSEEEEPAVEQEERTRLPRLTGKLALLKIEDAMVRFTEEADPGEAAEVLVAALHEDVEEILPTVLDLLCQLPKNKRKRALEIGDGKTVLAKLTEHEEGDIREMSTGLLWDMGIFSGSEGLQKLQEMLEDFEPRTRHEALQALLNMDLETEVFVSFLESGGGRLVHQKLLDRAPKVRALAALLFARLLPVGKTEGSLLKEEAVALQELFFHLDPEIRRDGLFALNTMVLFDEDRTIIQANPIPIFKRYFREEPNSRNLGIALDLLAALCSQGMAGDCIREGLLPVVLELFQGREELSEKLVLREPETCGGEVEEGEEVEGRDEELEREKFLGKFEESLAGVLEVLARSEDTRDLVQKDLLHPFRQLLNSPGSEAACLAARALGIYKDQQAVSLLKEMIPDETPATLRKPGTETGEETTVSREARKALKAIHEGTVKLDSKPPRESDNV